MKKFAIGLISGLMILSLVFIYLKLNRVLVPLRRSLASSIQELAKSNLACDSDADCVFISGMIDECSGFAEPVSKRNPHIGEIQSKAAKLHILELIFDRLFRSSYNCPAIAN